MILVNFSGAVDRSASRRAASSSGITALPEDLCEVIHRLDAGRFPVNVAIDYE
jgi:hypothetical protein